MFVVIGLPVLVLMFAIVVDVGNWYVHKKALQNEVDAGVLAGSQLWGVCFNGAGSPNPMYSEADKYDGNTGANWNPQVGGSLKGQLGIAYNSTTFPTDPPPNVGPDDTPANPCVATAGPDNKNHYLFDIKATENKVPPILAGPLAGLFPNIHATARTELREVTSLHGLLPLGVPNPNPKFVFAQFVDEDWVNGTSTPITSWIQFTKGGTNGVTQNWIAPETSVVIPQDTTHVGVRLRLVGGSDPNASCGQSLVDCYDASSAFGVVHIRAWSATQAAPAMRNASLITGSCSPDAYFSSLPCAGGVVAAIDLGRAPTASDNVWATIDGANTKYPLAKGSAVGNLVTWSTGAQDLSFSSTGAHTVSVLWNCPTNNKGCALGDLRAYVADPTGSGPVEGLQVTRLSASPPITGGLNSLQQGSSQSLGLALQTVGDFELQAVTAGAPVVYLRVKGSQNQTIDCDPALNNIRDEITSGCAPGYTVDSAGIACPDYNALWGTPQPWFCTKVQTGGAVGQVEQGFAARIGTNNATCGNHWPDFLPTDKRIVPLFLTPFGSFSGSGNTTVPVTGFGAFYVTGYNGDTCPNATPNVPKSFVAGHFIKYITDDPGATPSSTPCDPLDLVPCVPILVR